MQKYTMAVELQVGQGLINFLVHTKEIILFLGQYSLKLVLFILKVVPAKVLTFLLLSIDMCKLIPLSSYM